MMILDLIAKFLSIRASAVRQPPSLPSRRRSDTLVRLGVVMAMLTVNAAAFADSPGTTSGELLKIPVGTRAIGMGEAYTAMADDSSALYWNPAGMSFAQHKEATFMHSSLIENINYEHLSFIAPGDNYSFGTSMSYLGYGSIDGYDNTAGGGLPTGNQSAYAYNFAGGMSSLIRDSFAIGASASVLREQLADTGADTFAVNAGGIYALPVHPLMGDYRLGFAASNLGPGLKFIDERDPLPSRYSFGAAAMHVKNWPLNLTADLGIPNDNSTYFAAGSEYWLKDVVALRLGYNGENTVGKGLRVGVGLKLRNILFDYAYGGFGDFGATHRIGLSLQWGEKIKQLNSEERKILKEARAAGQQGDYVQQIMDMNQLLEKNPDNDHILKEMIKTHEAMLKKELGNAVAENKGKEAIPSPEEFALQDLVPGQVQQAAAPGAAAGTVRTMTGFNPNDPLGLNNLPDATDADVPSTEALLSRPEPAASSVSPTPTSVAAPAKTASPAVPAATSAPVVSQPVSSEAPASADSSNEPLINPADIK